jgi:hypothetical protein
VSGFPTSISCTLTPSRARVAVLLAVLLLFFGVALFSPLHRHKLGKTNSCSFNNLEHQMVSLAEAAVVLAPVAHVLEAHHPAETQTPAGECIREARDRAPPVFS